MPRKPRKDTRTTGNPALPTTIEARAHRRPPKETGQVVVQWDPDFLRSLLGTRSAPKRVKRAAGARATHADPLAERIEWLKNSCGLRKVEPLFSTADRAAATSSARGARAASRRPPHVAAAVASTVEESPQEFLAGFGVMQLDPKAVNASMLRKLASGTGVLAAARLPRRWLLAKAAKVDPMRNSQWALRAIGWFDRKLPDASDIDVAVIDTGVDASHPDLKAHIAEYHAGGFSRRDLIGHGTHCSGIVAAVANNEVGITGVANCKLRVWKVFPDEPDPDDGEIYVDGEAWLRALGFAAASQARVVSISLGGDEHNSVEESLFRLLRERNKLVVAAMGNEYAEGNPIEFPAAYPNVIGVGAVSVSLARSSFSNTGPHIGLCAPGRNILSTLPMKPSDFREPDEVEYAFWDGTSMATPCVAGCFALAFAKRPALQAKDLADMLPKLTKKVPGMKGKKFTQQFGYGIVNIPRILAAV